ncbi:protein DYAD [Gossypium australe]|uniref:Protein DYAD n=1 Tax=Gossypium australe TaxID=47621 RepID=A0A5B6W2K2_9ROSI|nr:protein DYAD [Gossypium australe]
MLKDLVKWKAKIKQQLTDISSADSQTEAEPPALSDTLHLWHRIRPLTYKNMTLNICELQVTKTLVMGIRSCLSVGLVGVYREPRPNSMECNYNYKLGQSIMEILC